MDRTTSQNHEHTFTTQPAALLSSATRFSTIIQHLNKAHDIIEILTLWKRALQDVVAAWLTVGG